MLQQHTGRILNFVMESKIQYFSLNMASHIVARHFVSFVFF